MNQTNQTLNLFSNKIPDVVLTNGNKTLLEGIRDTYRTSGIAVGTESASGAFEGSLIKFYGTSSNTVGFWYDREGDLIGMSLVQAND